MTRFLQVTRRRIPLDRSEAYAHCWHAVAAAATNHSAKAWVFESAHVAGFFTEFIEWQGGPEVPVVYELDELDSDFPPEECSVWTEATI